MVLEAESPWEAIRVALKAADDDQQYHQQMLHEDNASVSHVAPGGPPVEVDVPEGVDHRAGEEQSDHNMQNASSEPETPAVLRSDLCVLRGAELHDRKRQGGVEVEHVAPPLPTHPLGLGRSGLGYMRLTHPALLTPGRLPGGASQVREVVGQRAMRDRRVCH